jgi:hypothetical protein
MASSDCPLPSKKGYIYIYIYKKKKEVFKTGIVCIKINRNSPIALDIPRTPRTLGPSQ